MIKKNREKEIYTLTKEQKKAMAEAREQFRRGVFLTNAAATKEIDILLDQKN